MGAKMKADIHSFEDGLDFLEIRYSVRVSGDSKTLGHNTVVRYISDPYGCEEIHIILHSTPIVIYTSDKRVILFAGGFETITTKARMNACIPSGYRVYQKDWQWYVVTPDSETVEFFEGIEFLL